MSKGKLTLTTKEGDSFKIGEDITISVGEKVGGQRFKLRFEAPLEVNIEHKRSFKKNPSVILRKKKDD